MEDAFGLVDAPGGVWSGAWYNIKTVASIIMTSSHQHYCDKRRNTSLNTTLRIATRIALLLLIICSFIETASGNTYSVSILTSSSRHSHGRKKPQARTIQTSSCKVPISLSRGSQKFVASVQSCSVVSSSATVSCSSKTKVRRRKGSRRTQSWQKAIQLSQYGTASGSICSSAYWVKPRASRGRASCQLQLCPTIIPPQPATTTSTTTVQQAQITGVLYYPDLSYPDYGTPNLTEYLCDALKNITETQGQANGVTVSNCTVQYQNGSLIASFHFTISYRIFTNLFRIVLLAITDDTNKPSQYSQLQISVYRAFGISYAYTSVSLHEAKCRDEEYKVTDPACTLTNCTSCIMSSSATSLQQCFTCNDGSHPADYSCIVSTTLKPAAGTTAAAPVAGPTAAATAAGPTAGVPTAGVTAAAMTAAAATAAGATAAGPTVGVPTAAGATAGVTAAVTTAAGAETTQQNEVSTTALPACFADCSNIVYQASSVYCSSCNNYYYSNYPCCDACPANCGQCFNSTACTDLCDTGYWLTSKQFCQDCPSSRNCDKCESDTECSQCSASYYNTDIQEPCQACPTNCLICNSTGCIQCDITYGLDYLGNCAPCPDNCSLCAKSARCDTCSQGFYLNTDLGTCEACNDPNCYDCSGCCNCNYCNNGNQQGPNFYRNALTQQCSPCGSNCTNCNGGLTCSACVYGYYPSANGWDCTMCTPNCNVCNDSSTCSQCNDGSTLDVYGHCPSCPDPQCKDCSGTGQSCVICNDGYYNSSGSCIRCADTNCTTCDGGSPCTACNDGYELNAGMCAVIILTTSAPEIMSTQHPHICPDGCATFDDASGYCSACNAYFYFNNTCCQRCPANCLGCFNGTMCDAAQCDNGYTAMSSGSCLYCPPSLNCDFDSCETSTTCSKCAVSYVLMTDHTCAQCPADCDVCSSATVCTTCTYGYSLTSNGTCTNCPNNCLNCTGSKCYECTDGFYVSSSYTCLPCQDNCLQCTSATYCTSCNRDNQLVVNYYVNATHGCSECGINCTSCDATSCATCSDGQFTTSNGVDCQACVPHCQNCADPNACAQCVDGYYVDNNTLCQPCSTPMCAYCPFSGSTDVCETCFGFDAYWVNSSGLCQPCDISNCTHCAPNSPVTTCDICSGDLQPNADGSQCIECQGMPACSAHTDADCSGPGTCDPSGCQTDYAFNNSTLMCDPTAL